MPQEEKQSGYSKDRSEWVDISSAETDLKFDLSLMDFSSGGEEIRTC